MADVIDFDAFKGKKDHSSHTIDKWVKLTVPQSVVEQNIKALPGDAVISECNRCGFHLFFVSPDGHWCGACGAYFYGDV